MKIFSNVAFCCFFALVFFGCGFTVGGTFAKRTPVMPSPMMPLCQDDDAPTKPTTAVPSFFMECDAVNASLANWSFDFNRFDHRNQTNEVWAGFVGFRLVAKDPTKFTPGKKYRFSVEEAP